MIFARGRALAINYRGVYEEPMQELHISNMEAAILALSIAITMDL